MLCQWRPSSPWPILLQRRQQAAGVDFPEQAVQSAHADAGLLRSQQSFFQGLGHFVQVYDADLAGGIEDVYKRQALYANIMLQKGVVV